MSHLSPERLAALVDETATPDEASHLAGCAACAHELGAHRRLVRLAAAAKPIEGPPLNDWASLGAMLKAEGIVGASVERPAAAPMRAPRRWMQVAAAMALVVGGALGGRYLPTAASGVMASRGATAPTNATTNASTMPAAPSFESPQAAMQVLTSAQQQYSDAASYLASQDTSAHFIGLNVNTYRARLNALDEIVASTRTALYQAPQDPVLNQYYLSAVAAREATLKQYKAALPAAQRLERY